MVCLGLEPAAAGWKAPTNPLSYCGTPTFGIFSIYIPGRVRASQSCKPTLQRNDQHLQEPNRRFEKLFRKPGMLSRNSHYFVAQKENIFMITKWLSFKQSFWKYTRPRRNSIWYIKYFQFYDRNLFWIQYK